jgi:hypothetical protein
MILYELCNIESIWYIYYLCACKIVSTFSNLRVVWFSLMTKPVLSSCKCFNRCFYLTCTSNVNIIGSHIVRTSRCLFYFKLAWRWLYEQPKHVATHSLNYSYLLLWTIVVSRRKYIYIYIYIYIYVYIYTSILSHNGMISIRKRLPKASNTLS